MNETFALQSIGLGLLMLSAHLCGRLALKLKIGQMIGQLIGGIIVGPYFLRSVGVLDALNIANYGQAFETFHFIIFAFLGVIAFAIGEELHIDRMRKVGAKAIWITFMQAGLTWVLLTSFFLIVGLKWYLALVIGSIGIATAPAITFALLNHLEIEGRFRNMVANILVLDDVLEVILFSIFVQIAAVMVGGGEIRPAEIASHLGAEFGEALLVGFGVFIFLKLTVRSKHLHQVADAPVATLGPKFLSRLLSVHPTPSLEILVIVIGSVTIATGLGLAMNLPFLIIGVFAGILTSNFHTHALFDSLKIDNIMPLLNLVFFAMIGANINLSVFSGNYIWLVTGYVAIRGFAKLAGTYAGCRITRQDPKVVSCLPYLMLPQAGVAAVEAVYVVTLLGEAGNIVANIVLPSLVIFEIVGVFLSERALCRWRQWTMGEAQVLTREEKVHHEISREGSSLINNLAQYVPPGVADIKIKSTTLPEAIKELATGLEQNGYIVDGEAVIDRSLSREKMGSTAIGYGIAIPHCKTLGLTRIVCAMGHLETPLEDIKGPDEIPINTIILIVSPLQHPDSHLKALSTIAHIFSDKISRELFVNAMCFGNIEQILRPGK